MESIGSDSVKPSITYTGLFFVTLWIDDRWAIIAKGRNLVHSCLYWRLYWERHSSIVRFVLSIIAFPCGWQDVVDVLWIASSLQRLRNNFDIKFDPRSLCRLTGQPNVTIQCSTNALDTVFASWLGKATALYDLRNWSPINNMYLFPWDWWSGLLISRDNCQNVWLGFHFKCESQCIRLVPFLFRHTSQLSSQFLTYLLMRGQ